MKMENCVRKENKNRSVVMSIRTTKEISQWMKDNNLSPTSVFNEAIKELGYTSRLLGSKGKK